MNPRHIHSKAIWLLEKMMLTGHLLLKGEVLQRWTSWSLQLQLDLVSFWQLRRSFWLVARTPSSFPEVAPGIHEDWTLEKLTLGPTFEAKGLIKSIKKMLRASISVTYLPCCLHGLGCLSYHYFDSSSYTELLC